MTSVVPGEKIIKLLISLHDIYTMYVSSCVGRNISFPNKTSMMNGYYWYLFSCLKQVRHRKWLPLSLVCYCLCCFFHPKDPTYFVSSGMTFLHSQIQASRSLLYVLVGLIILYCNYFVAYFVSSVDLELIQGMVTSCTQDTNAQCLLGTCWLTGKCSLRE
jgi:hypothetical protein